MLSGIFQNQVSRYMCTWRASSRRRAAAFPSPGREKSRKRSWTQRGLKQEGSSRGRAGARISRRDLRCTRVMICGRPDRDPVLAGSVGWRSGEGTHAFQEPSAAWRPRRGRERNVKVAERKREGERSAGPDYAEGVMDGLICEI